MQPQRSFDSHEDMRSQVELAVNTLRERVPLIGSITNAVSVDFVVNAQLACGASAAVVYMEDEACSLAEVGDAFYVNMGTLLPLHNQSIPAVARCAHELDTPWVLDPVGIGIGSLRSEIMALIKEFKPAVIRGNASEIIALAGVWELDGFSDEAKRVRGVDSTDDVSSAKDAACALAQWTGGAVVVSGEKDLVTDGNVILRSYGGSALASKVTGFGCSLGGVVAAYASVADPLVAGVAAVSHYNAAGTLSAQIAHAPARFKQAFIDALYELSPCDIAANPFDLSCLASHEGSV